MKIRPVYITLFKIVLVVSIIVLFWQYIRSTNFSEVLPAIRKVGGGFGYVVVTTFTAYWLGTLAWWYCLGDSKVNISKWRLFTIRHVCETVGLFNPASFAGADMLKVIVLKPYSIPRETVLTSVVISRILIIFSQLILIALAVIWLLVNRDIGVTFLLKLLITVSILVGLLVVGLVIYKLVASSSLQDMPIEINSSKSRLGRFKTRVRNVRQELNLFFRHHKTDLVMASVFSALHWIVGSLEFYILVRLLGYDISIMDGLLLDMGVILIKSTGAFIPGQIGVEEIGNKMMLALIGISSASIWLSISVLRRTRQIFWILAGAIFYLIFIRKEKIYN